MHKLSSEDPGEMSRMEAFLDHRSVLGPMTVMLAGNRLFDKIVLAARSHSMVGMFKPDFDLGKMDV